MGGNEDDIIPAIKISPAEGPFFCLPSFVSCVTHLYDRNWHLQVFFFFPTLQRSDLSVKNSNSLEHSRPHWSFNCTISHRPPNESLSCCSSQEN